MSKKKQLEELTKFNEKFIQTIKEDVESGQFERDLLSGKIDELIQQREKIDDRLRDELKSYRASKKKRSKK